MSESTHSDPETHPGTHEPSRSLTLIRGGIRTIVDLAIFGSIGYSVHFWIEGEWIGWFGAVVALFSVAAIWIVCRVPGDVGLPVPLTIPISGRVRLLIEFVITGIAAYGLWTTASRAAGETLLTLVGIHYAVTWDRVRWLLTTPSRANGKR